MQNKISIINYEMGNLLSVAKKVKLLGVPYEIISTAEEIAQAEKLILPGVGHFGKAMENLKKLDLLGALNEAVLEKKTPVLGICLGMQLMTKFSEEGDVAGLGWFDAEVKKMKMNNTLRYKVPHTGWSLAEFNAASPLAKDIPAESEFYFVHAYAVYDAPKEEILTTSFYERPFISGLSKNNIFGVQFHPEKSHQIGAQLIKNFISL
jgi:glutamine amidotransferase